MKWFNRKKEKEVKFGEIRISKTIPRPTQYDYNHIDSNKKKEIIERMRNSENARIDSEFLQSIIDKAFGSKGEEYLSKLIDLNNNYPSREGRTGSQIFEDRD